MQSYLKTNTLNEEYDQLCSILKDCISLESTPPEWIQKQGRCTYTFPNDDHCPLVELTVKNWNIKQTWLFLIRDSNYTRVK